MSKLLVVFGATGQQGGSVVETILVDPGLSKEYSLRGTTRDVGSFAAQALTKKGVEVDRAELDNALTPESL
jgi:uncharacterized protein YbjT (DUF2867 family)